MNSNNHFGLVTTHCPENPNINELRIIGSPKSHHELDALIPEFIAIRQQKGMSQEDLSAVLHMRKSFIEHYEEKGRIHSLELFLKVVWALGVKIDAQVELNMYIKASEWGDTEAMYHLGRQYLYGRRVERDVNKAVRFWSEAAAKGHIIAQFCLAELYFKGHFIKQDCSEAITWYSKAAENGHWGAQRKLAYLYENGIGVEQNYQQAANWYLQAAEREDEYSQYSLGILYDEGWGVKQDEREAFKWFLLAADKGHPYAQYEVGLHYFNGFIYAYDDVDDDVDYDKAISWLKKSAIQGVVEAQYELSCLYCYGFGVVQNYLKAYFWALIACARADEEMFEEASSIRDKVVEQIDNRNTIRLQKLATWWVSKYN